MSKIGFRSYYTSRFFHSLGLVRDLVDIEVFAFKTVAPGFLMEKCSRNTSIFFVKCVGVTIRLKCKHELNIEIGTEDPNMLDFI